MRKIILVIVLGIFVTAGFFCFALYKIASHTDISFQVNDSDDFYEMRASYGRNQTKRIMSYVDLAITNNHNKRFRKEHINEDVVLSDHAHFHIKSSPGRIQIKLNKDENDPETIERFKKITEGIKIRLTNGHED
jgi:hypothetical protein